MILNEELVVPGDKVGWFVQVATSGVVAAVNMNADALTVPRTARTVTIADMIANRLGVFV